MENIEYLINGFLVALSWQNLLFVILGCLVGTAVGALPGLGPINAIAILLPITYTLDLPVESALILLAAVYYGAEYGGRISSILLNVPGDAGAIMTTIDGHPMAKAKQARKALGLSAVSSFVGSMIGLVIMVFSARFLSDLAIAFGPQHFVALMVFSFSCLAVMVGSRPVKTLASVFIGLAIATIGVDMGSGVLRYTFGFPNLQDGMDFLVVIIGLFAISEILLLAEKTYSSKPLFNHDKTEDGITWRDILQMRWVMLRSSLVGFLIGVLPGTGASVGSAVAYGVEKRLADSKGDSKFGEGDRRGLTAPECANNGSAVGAMIPMLTLGIPGSGTTAVLLGILMLYNINPGPMLLDQQPNLVWGLVASMFIGNFVLLLLNLPLVKYFIKLIQIPTTLLIPFIMILTFAGIYSLHGDVFDVFVAILLGVIGFIMRKLQFPIVAVVLGYVLGGVLEENLRRALSISGGEWGILWSDTLTVCIWLLAGLALVMPIILKRAK